MRAPDKLEFAKLADAFELINNRTRDVYVPYGEGCALLEELWHIGVMTAKLRRGLQHYCVGLSPYEFERAHGVLCELREGSEIWIAADGAYDKVMGLKMELEESNLIC